MNDDIIRMAQEAGLIQVSEVGVIGPFPEVLERFADLARADEREACAKVCESMRPSEREFDQRFHIACTLNANAIRARGTRPTSVIYSPGELAARGLTHEDVVKLIKENK